MSAGTVRNFVERVVERHADAFESAFPAPFDWRALCADAPEMARRLGRASPHDEPRGDEDDLVPEIDLVETAEQTFARAYLGGLAGVALAVEDDSDPELLLERLLEPLADDEEPRFEALAASSLGPVERALAEQGAALDEDSPEGAALTLVDAAWPSVEVALEGLVPFDPEQDLELPHAVRQVLSGVARLAAILAAFRWLSTLPPG